MSHHVSVLWGIARSDGKFLCIGTPAFVFITFVEGQVMEYLMVMN